MAMGEQIGYKFGGDGAPLRYPGNTVISDIRPGNPAYAVMCTVRARLLETGLAPLFILLPKDSYHMTVLRGLNDQVRTDAFWPAALPKDAPLERADAYVARAVASVLNPGPIRMAFDCVHADAADLRVRLKPADALQAEALRSYRDQVADALGLWLPGHDAYTYHMTLAYTHFLPDSAQADRLRQWVSAMDALLAEQPRFETDAPYTAYYANMLFFSPDPNPVR